MSGIGAVLDQPVGILAVGQSQPSYAGHAARSQTLFPARLVKRLFLFAH
jgi:hypothetical protein